MTRSWRRCASRRSGCRARAAELATRYATDRLALALLARARRRFEEEQQPRVIQLASEHFAALTGGRYRRVFIPAGGKRELRVSDARRDWSAEQLSRGTREQLYLAFRLAVIQDFGETRGALPLIVDDILVNFDLERTRGTLQVALPARRAPPGHRLHVPPVDARVLRGGGSAGGGAGAGKDRGRAPEDGSRGLVITSQVSVAQNWWASVESSRARVLEQPPEMTSATWSK